MGNLVCRYNVFCIIGITSKGRSENSFFYNTMKIFIISRGDWLLGARSARAAGLGGLGREAGGRSG